ncbi:CocE/NonD family hydrolase, partial [Nocardia gipuzkoensis]
MRHNRILRGSALAAIAVLVVSGCGGSGTSGGGATTTGPWPTAAGRGSCAVTKQENVPATMRDGVVLKADVYRPQTADP